LGRNLGCLDVGWTGFGVPKSRCEIAGEAGMSEAPEMPARAWFDAALPRVAPVPKSAGRQPSA
jgi:hypothetical protein